MSARGELGPLFETQRALVTASGSDKLVAAECVSFGCSMLITDKPQTVLQIGIIKHFVPLSLFVSEKYHYGRNSKSVLLFYECCSL